MDHQKRKNTLITILVTPYERELLESITEADGLRNMSGTFRRFIREEARRFGILPPLPSGAHFTQPEPEPETYPGELVID